jgi:hypothetical protein
MFRSRSATATGPRPVRAPIDMVRNLVTNVASRCRAEPGRRISASIAIDGWHGWGALKGSKPG